MLTHAPGKGGNVISLITIRFVEIAASYDISADGRSGDSLWGQPALKGSGINSGKVLNGQVSIKM